MFLSHFKQEAAGDARFLKDKLEERVREPVFLDSDDLQDLADQFGQDSGLIRTVVNEHLRESLGRVFDKFDEKVRDGETEVKVTLQKTSNRKVIRTFRETMTWVWVDDEWYCEEPDE